MKKLLTLLTMLTIFTMPVLAHAENSSEVSSGERMVVKKNNSSETLGKVTEELKVGNYEKQENDSIIHSSKDELGLFTEQVNRMSGKAVDEMISKFASKSKLTDVEKEKVRILNETYDKTNEMKSTLAFLLIISLSLAASVILLFILMTIR